MTTAVRQRDYDKAGNWLGYDVTSATTGQGFNQTREHELTNAISQIDASDALVDHDGAGNSTKMAPRWDSAQVAEEAAAWGAAYDLKWDAWNRLVEVEAGTTVVASYEYDGLWRRTKKTTAAETRDFYYSDRWQIVEERVDGATAADRQPIWGVRHPEDLVVEMYGSEPDRRFALHDYYSPLASVSWNSGSLTRRYAYLAFGQPRVMDENWADLSVDEADLEHLYTFKPFDEETGYYQNRYRYLTPSTGRWPSRDPIGERGGANLYTANGNNSTNTNDQLGLFFHGAALRPTVERFAVAHFLSSKCRDEKCLPRCGCNLRRCIREAWKIADVYVGIFHKVAIYDEKDKGTERHCGWLCSSWTNFMKRGIDAQVNPKCWSISTHGKIHADNLIHNYVVASLGGASDDETGPRRDCAVVLDPWTGYGPKAYPPGDPELSHDWNFDWEFPIPLPNTHPGNPGWEDLEGREWDSDTGEWSDNAFGTP